MYNGRMAVLAGSLAAFLAMLLFYLGLVPSYQRTFAIEGAAYDFGPYGLSAGCIVSAWVLLLLPPKGSRIFLDRICRPDPMDGAKRRGGGWGSPRMSTCADQIKRNPFLPQISPPYPGIWGGGLEPDPTCELVPGARMQ